MPLFDTNNRLKLTKLGFKQQKSLFETVELKWRDITEAVGIKRDIIAHPDNLIILIAGAKRVSLSEADTDFRNFEPRLLENLPGFPSDWYDRIEAQPFETPLSLWKRQT